MFGPMVKLVSFKNISIFISGGHFVQWSRKVCASLVEGSEGSVGDVI